MKRPKLSVIVLCYRSGEAARAIASNIAGLLDDAAIHDHQLVLVGNYLEGSEDCTPDVVRELAHGNPRVVCSSVPKKGMMGWDMRTGLVLATGEALAVIDGDGQVLIEDLVRIYRLLHEKQLDLAMTYRLQRGDGIKRRLFSAGLNGLFRLLFPGVAVQDINAKPKILTRSAYERLSLVSTDWFIDAEILIQARRLGLRIGEIETEFLGLTGRRSFVRLTAVFEFVRNLLVHRFREFWRRPA
jgi:glycosyltransferase involved in cell wall biosynthesis